MALLQVCILALLAIHCAAPTRVTLSKNGYSDLVVAISPDVPKTEAVAIIDNIKGMITNASSVLYEATRHRAYFQSVRILIPKEWDNVQAAYSTWETFEDADVKVDLPSGRYGDKPYTIQPGGCGQPGRNIQMTPDFLTKGVQNGLFGEPQKLFVAEWARLRYGVFEEIGSASVPQYPLFYVDSAGDIVPNACFKQDDQPMMYSTEDANGGACNVDPLTGIYHKNCTIVWSSSYRPSSSLMTYHQVESVVHFCDDTTHNAEAPTKHNIQCNSRSVWSIITQHSDFANNSNPPRNISSLVPTFTLVKAEAARFVLLADISGSMISYDRIGRLNKAGRRWIQYDVGNGSKVGIVTFGTTASTSSPLTVINDSTRSTLANKVPSSTNGWTCIGCGLETSVQVLNTAVNKGGVILLISDGEENQAPYVRNVMSKLVDSQARVVSMAFGQSASALIEDLAEQTGGKSYFINDDVTMSILNGAFVDSLTYQPAVGRNMVIVTLAEKKYQNKGTILRDTFAVDSTANRNLRFRLEYGNRNYITSVQLTSPSGVVYGNVVYDTTANLGYIDIAAPQIGTWSFQLEVRSSTTDYVTVSVTAQASSSMGSIKTHCSVQTGPNVLDPFQVPVRVVATVTQDGNPVIGASVKAYIERPDDNITVLDLKDDGVFADVTAGDGIYSRFFVSVSNLGRYSVICEVYNPGSAYIDNGFIANGAPINGRSRTTGRSAIGNFTRSAVGGSFNAKAVLNNSDPYPPGRVLDLQGVANIYDMTVTLQWTAPGDDLDDGTVLRYQIKYSDSFYGVNDNNFSSGINSTELDASSVYDGSLQPLESGNRQTVTFRFPFDHINTTFYFALRAFDDVNKSSPTSNVASVQLVQTVPVPELPSFNCTEDGNFPQEGERCSQYYYVCSLGQLYTHLCIPSYVFEPYNRTCVPADSAIDCRVTRCQTDGDFPLNDQCNEHYVICLGGIGYSAMCPTGEVFDPVHLTCVPDLQSSCKNPPTQSPVGFVCPETNGYFPHDSHCHLFYSCSNSIVYIMDCPAGLVFNSKISVCDYPKNVPGCENSFVVSRL